MSSTFAMRSILRVLLLLAVVLLLLAVVAWAALLVVVVAAAVEGAKAAKAAEAKAEAASILLMCSPALFLSSLWAKIRAIPFGCTLRSLMASQRSLATFRFVSAK